jgi:hypothetical protein
MCKYLQHLPHQQNSHIYLKQFSSSCHNITVSGGGGGAAAGATAVTLHQAQSESKCSRGHLFTGVLKETKALRGPQSEGVIN